MDKNTDGSALGCGPLVAIFAAMAVIVLAGAYGVWFLATHWHTIFPS